MCVAKKVLEKVTISKSSSFTTEASPSPGRAFVVQNFFLSAITKSQNGLIDGRTVVKKSQNSWLQIYFKAIKKKEKKNG